MYKILDITFPLQKMRTKVPKYRDTTFQRLLIERMQQLRSDHGYSQEEVIEFTHLDISRYESGTSIPNTQSKMQAKTADNGNGLKIENAEVVDEVVKPSKAEPLSAASGNQEEPPEEREHVVPPPESDFIRNHILLVRPATNVKAKGPKL